MTLNPSDSGGFFDLAESHERYRLVAQHTRDLILILDPRGHIMWASPSSTTVLGRPPETVVGHHCGEFLHPDDRELQRDVFRLRLDEKHPRRVELRVQRADGTYVETESLGVPIFAADGSVEKVLICARDITERKHVERRMRSILEQLPANVWTADRDLIITSSQGGGLAAVGLQPGQLNGLSLEVFLQDTSVASLAMDVHRRALQGETIAYETQWRDRDLLMRVQPLRDANGAIEGVIGMTFDITDQKRAERRYQSLFARNLAGVFRSTVSGRLLECNEAFVRMFGYASAEEMASLDMPSVYFSSQDREELITVIRARGEIANFEVRLRRRDGQVLWALLNETIVRDEATGDDILEGTIIDITARKVAEERIEYQAFHDSLTDLPNRFLFNDRLALAVAQAKRHGRSVAVLFLDLDHFKLINDTMAHSAGDELLRAVAARLMSCLRSDDTVARIGGDEFVFILPEFDQSSAAAGAAKVAEKVLDAVRHPFMIHGRELFVSASVGIAISPHDGSDADTIVKNADSAMYRAKELGRNNYQFFTPLAQRRAEVRLTLETALRRALEREELFLVYQPIVDLRTGSISGFEALVRWQRPGFGVVEPKDFIPLAEEIGMIVPIGEWVLWSGCRQMHAWHERGHRDLRLSINLSPRQFQHESMIRMVEGVLEETQFDARRLDLEITESLSIRDSDLTIGRLSHFRSLGISVSLDDFGTGYSSLGQLRFLPIDTVKIDRSFITDLHDDGAEKAIVQAIITMAHSLKLRVVAEGVETEEQRRIVTALGCDEMQGWLFSRAVDPAAAELLLGPKER
ncbi:MAG TPA: EAL domain-containing protein [Thermoanaerobaculia bacterium]